MPGSWPPGDFPFLTADNHTVTSKATRRYNCIAWAASENETHRRWDPDPQGIYYWPPGIPRSTRMDVVAQAYGTLGYRPCPSMALEDGIDKIAIYGVTRNGVAFATHAARQLPSGEWTSKLGDYEDIRHPDLGAVNGMLYGEAVLYMQRPRPSP